MGCGYALGPLTLVAVGTERLAPFAVAVGAFALCALVLTAVARGLPGFDGGEDGGNVLGFARLAPAPARSGLPAVVAGLCVTLAAVSLYRLAARGA